MDEKKQLQAVFVRAARAERRKLRRRDWRELFGALAAALLAAAALALLGALLRSLGERP